MHQPVYIMVGVGEMLVVDSPHRLIGMALGSCVALMCYDARARVAGMAHVMLPAAPSPDTATPGKYADTAVRGLVDAMLEKGARKALIIAKLAGGAQMFATNHEGPAIGERNAESLASLLKSEHIPVAAQETGGRWARTVEFDTTSGLAVVRLAHGREFEI